ncbi:acyl-CoA carboxylase subunit epsilon [Amycolatopsis sp. WAC 01375]|uniref:acyl-CoA carboxylase subunit epsilon n=1 Tax=unclassified Amycolatopsis TaxID=2618356 RepID=UPI000F7BAF8A|nr:MULTISPECIES: acyl-CoA carboxylase subunit epsilon [unclassified Amycolatopsis]RSM84179.1 acyl-CoA carboxylase subunit epsilon [Amycolatopsis sp. WAC 01375]RSN22224.1 acyl-CoA carboxylase subunit epsilon [Amycolatopsis sp. WAC 01416]
MSPSEKDSAPIFRVLRGDPEDAELAALVAVFTALASAAPPPAAPARSAWSSRTPATWRTSVLR